MEDLNLFPIQRSVEVPSELKDLPCWGNSIKIGQAETSSCGAGEFKPLKREGGLGKTPTLGEATTTSPHKNPFLTLTCTRFLSRKFDVSPVPSAAKWSTQAAFQYFVAHRILDSLFLPGHERTTWQRSRVGKENWLSSAPFSTCRDHGSKQKKSIDPQVIGYLKG